MSNQLSIASIPVRQFNQLYSLNDLHLASGGELKHKPSNFLRVEQTKELITEIERCSNMSNAVITKRGGEFQGSFGCKEIVYAYAMWISPAFMLKVIRAYDEMYGNFLPNTINEEQKYLIKKAVNERVYRTGEKHQAIYHKLYDQFRIKSYENLPSSRFEDAIKFLGGVHIKSTQFTDDELCTLAWCYKAAERMRQHIKLVTDAMYQIKSEYAPSFYSMGVEYARTLENARKLIDRETRHITIEKQGYLSNNWVNVLPNIRQTNQIQQF